MPNGNQPQQQAPTSSQEEPKFSLFDIKALPKHVWNLFWRLPGIRRWRVGRKRAVQYPKIWYELNKTWFPKNTAWFNTKLRTIEDKWNEMGVYYGSSLDQTGESSLLGNPNGVVSFYSNLGAYSDIERVRIEANWFQVGTGYIEENLRLEVPNNQNFWDRFKWKNRDKVIEVVNNPDLLQNFTLKRIRLSSGIVYHEGKKEYEEELYCFGYPNAEQLAKRIINFNDVIERMWLGHRVDADVRGRRGEAAREIQKLINTIAEIEKETFVYLSGEEGKSGLSGQIATYQQKWEDLVNKLSPERHPGNVVVIRFPHTYRIIKQHVTEEAEERIENDREVYEDAIYDKSKNQFTKGKKITQYPLKRKVIMWLKQDKNIYEEEKEDLIKKVNEMKREDPLKYAVRIRNYEQRLRDIGYDITNKKDINSSITNKDGIIRQTTPKVKIVDYSQRHEPGAEFWKRPEEVDVGLDENGYPLEIAPTDNPTEGWKKGMILIDKWWSELADNTWQLKTIAMKPGGRDVLKTHLGVDVEYFEGESDEDDIDRDEIKLRARIIGTPKREIRYVRDERFYGHVDLLELGHIIYSYWDAVRDDLRDGRFHRWSKTVADYVIESQGGFDEARGAPYLKSWGTISREKGIFLRRRGIVPLPLKPTGINADFSDKNVLIKATPAWFEKVPSDEMSIKQDFRMKMPDGSFISGIRRPTKYNPAFDRRAENLDFVHWGRIYYYRWISYPNEWSENPFPHVSTRGLALYIDHLVKSDVWNYKDAEDVLEGHKFDYGVRGQGEYGFVNPATGKGILQEN